MREARSGFVACVHEVGTLLRRLASDDRGREDGVESENSFANALVYLPEALVVEPTSPQNVLENVFLFLQTFLYLLFIRQVLHREEKIREPSPNQVR